MPPNKVKYLVYFIRGCRSGAESPLPGPAQQVGQPQVTSCDLEPEPATSLQLSNGEVHTSAAAHAHVRLPPQLAGISTQCASGPTIVWYAAQPSVPVQSLHEVTVRHWVAGTQWPDQQLLLSLSEGTSPGWQLGGIDMHTTPELSHS